jgi:multidrug efflux system membrane fusion protein
MRLRIWLIFLFVAVGGIFFFRAQLAPYLPSFISERISPASPAQPAGAIAADKAPAQTGVQAVTVAVATAKAGSLPVLRQTIGTITPIASTALSSPAAGTVTKILVKDGDNVKTGDVLVQLDDRTIRANIARDTAVLARDQAALDNANTTLQRIEKLNTDGADTRQQYDDAVSAVKQATAAVGIDNATLQADQVALTQTRITAPFDGKLGVVIPSLGTYLSAGAEVATLTRMAPVYAEFVLSEADLDLARSALANKVLTVSVSAMLADGDGHAVTGPIVFIDNAVDPASGTFKLRALLSNDTQALWPGQSVDVEVNAGARDGLVLVPVVALQPNGDGSIGYVVKPDKTVEQRKVAVAFNAGDTAGVTSGLKDGETVVVEGQAGLSDGSRVRIAAASGGTAAVPVLPGKGSGVPAGGDAAE